MEPCSVAMLVFGDNTPQGQIFLDLVARGKIDCHPPVDVREFLTRDPAKKRDSVSHQENADSTRTQRALLNAGAKFVTAVSEVAYDVNRACFDEHGGRYRRASGGKIYPLYCTAGRHRCDGTAKFAQHAVLNAVVVGGKRVFNCNVFSLSDARTAADVRDMVQHAQKWLAEPFELHEPDADFGKEASSISADAKAAWDAIVGITVDLVGWHEMAQNAAQLRGCDRDDDVQGSSSSPSEPRDKKRSRRSEHRNKKRSRRTSARSSGHHNKKSRRNDTDVRRSPPQRAEHDRATLTPRASSSMIEQVAERELAERPNTPTPPVRRARPWDRPTRTVCPCCGEGYISADTPEFASFALTESSLYSTMKNLGMDEHAMHIAFLLVQRFEQDGLKEVQGVIMNVIKNFEWIANPSAFVSKACINFRKSREPHHTT